jgi:hypothetical protein
MQQLFSCEVDMKNIVLFFVVAALFATAALAEIRTVTLTVSGMT